MSTNGKRKHKAASNRHGGERNAQQKTEAGMTTLTMWVPTDRLEAVRRYVKQVGRRRNGVTLDDVMERLRSCRPILEERFGLRKVFVFGSVARNQAQAHSDIDLLVDFADGYPSGLFAFVDLKHWLEGRLGRPVDIITDTNVKPRIRRRILEDCVEVF